MNPAASCRNPTTPTVWERIARIWALSFIARSATEMIRKRANSRYSLKRVTMSYMRLNMAEGSVSPALDQHFAIAVEVLENFARPAHDCRQGILRDVHGEVCL